MNKEDLEKYEAIRNGGHAVYEQKRGLIAVWGKESVQFLNGLVTNDVAKLDDGAEILAAFPNAQGRLLAVVRIRRHGERLLFSTEEVTHEKVYNNLFRFTFAGDFFVEDLSDQFRYFSTIGTTKNGKWKMENADIVSFGDGVFVPLKSAVSLLSEESEFVVVSDDLFNVLRIENGVPLYGVDMDETTIVPELGLDGLISYNKGCYIGQEIIARIYFRGHVAKQLRGLILSDSGAGGGDEMESVDGKKAGKVTSVCYSPKLGKDIALGFVRYDYLAAGTELRIGDVSASVTDLPFAG